MIATFGVILWIALVFVAILVAGKKRRSRIGWGLLTAFVPLVVLVLFFLPDKAGSGHVTA